MFKDLRMLLIIVVGKCLSNILSPVSFFASSFRELEIYYMFRREKER